MLSALLRTSEQQTGRTGKVIERTPEHELGAHQQAAAPTSRGAWSHGWDRAVWFGTPHMWRRITDAGYSAFTVGGVLVVPVTTVLAIVGSLVPGHTPLHQLGGTFYGSGALWFIIALCGTHLKRSRTGREPQR